MTTFCLIHGSWHGGWCWAELAARLIAKGDEVIAPSLAGCAERAGLLTAALTLEDLIADIADRLGGARGVVLVGHSSGAMIAAEIVRRMADRVAHLVLLDGIAVEPGQTGFSVYPAAERDARIAAAARSGGLAVPPPDPLPAAWGLDGAEFAASRRAIGPHPLVAFTTPLAGLAAVAGPRISYVECTAPAHPLLEASRRIARRHAHRWVQLAAPHDPMLTHPAEVLRILAEIVTPDPAVAHPAGGGE